METNDQGREDHPNDRNPDEVNFTEPGKEIKAQQKIDITQSGLRREQGQTPADAHIENHLSQIDEQTKQMHVNGFLDQEQRHEATSRHAGYMNDETSADRDTGNSHNDGWESSRTARHK